MPIHIDHIKQTGATFTPVKLANFIAEKLLLYINADGVKILDPACGEGILLNSLSKLLNNRNSPHHLVGYDLNKTYLNTANTNLISIVSKENVNLIQADFLNLIDPETQQLSLSFSDKKDVINNSFDVIIANPPYVRTQTLGADYAQNLAKKFNLKGRVDLYYPFLIGMTNALKENGIMGVITSNRYLFTKSGGSIREFLEKNFEILEIIDLGDTKLFDAAVLPAIFIGRKKTGFNNQSASFTKIYEELNGDDNNYHSSDNIYDVLDTPSEGYFKVENKRFKKTLGTVTFTKAKDALWTMLSGKEANWVDKIKQHSTACIGDYFKVRVGIKTTADKVFIRDKWEDLKGEKPENELLRDLISQENIKTWSVCDKTKLQVLYTHFNVNGKKQAIDLEAYPKAKKYFEQHIEVLQKRKYVIDAGRNWYEIWVSQNPDLWKFPKLVFPDISSSPRFYFDDSGKIVNGNCYWIVAQNPKDTDLLLLIQGLANSNLMVKYHDLMFNNKLYSGKRRYFSQYVEKYPLPDIHSAASKAIIETVRKLHQANVDDIKYLEKELEIQVAEAFGVEPVFNQD